MIEFSIRPKSSSNVVWAYHSIASLGISLGNENETGDRLRSIINWMYSQFDTIIIDLSDTLYRWSKHDSTGSLVTDAHKLAQQDGELWIKENSDILNGLTSVSGKVNLPLNLIRWDTWIKHSEFGDQLHAFEKLFNNDSVFHELVNADVERFLDRNRKRGGLVNETVRKNSISYVLEEVTAHTLLARTYPGLIQVYPGSDLKTSNAIRAGKVPEASFGLQRVPFVSLRVGESSREIPKSAAQPALPNLAAA